MSNSFIMAIIYFKHYQNHLMCSLFFCTDLQLTVCFTNAVFSIQPRVCVNNYGRQQTTVDDALNN